MAEYRQYTKQPHTTTKQHGIYPSGIRASQGTRYPTTKELCNVLPASNQPSMWHDDYKQDIELNCIRILDTFGYIDANWVTDIMHRKLVQESS